MDRRETEAEAERVRVLSVFFLKKTPVSNSTGSSAEADRLLQRGSLD
jgi:hypothetical protein